VTTIVTSLEKAVGKVKKFDFRYVRNIKVIIKIIWKFVITSVCRGIPKRVENVAVCDGIIVVVRDLSDDRSVAVKRLYSIQTGSSSW